MGGPRLELANRLHVTPATVYNWERGKYEPTASMFRRIAQAFGVSMDDIALVEPAGQESEGKAAA